MPLMKSPRFLGYSSYRVGFLGVSPSTVGRLSSEETGRSHVPEVSRISYLRSATAMTSDHHCSLHHQSHGSHHKRHRHQLHHRSRCRGPALVAIVALWVAVACFTVPTASPSPATGDMSLLTMQRIKSYVDDTCTLDPHCQWTWDPLPNGLRNVSSDEALAAMPNDYLFPPGEDAEKPGQRGKCPRIQILG